MIFKILTLDFPQNSDPIKTIIDLKKENCECTFHLHASLLNRYNIEDCDYTKMQGGAEFRVELLDVKLKNMIDVRVIVRRITNNWYEVYKIFLNNHELVCDENPKVVVCYRPCNKEVAYHTYHAIKETLARALAE